MGESSQQFQPGVPAAVQPTVNSLQGLAGQRSYKPVQYGQPITAGVTPGQTNSLNYLRGLTYNPSQVYGAGKQNLSDTLSGKYMNPETNPYLSSTADAITEKAKRAFAGTMDQSASGSNAGGNLYSTSAMGKNQGIANDFTTNLTNSLSALYGQNYSNERGAQQSAWGQALNYDQQPYSQGLSLFGAEGVPQQIESASDTANYSDWTRYQQSLQGYDPMALQQQDLMALLQNYPLAYPSYTPGRSPWQDFGSVAGGIGSLAMGGAAVKNAWA